MIFAPQFLRRPRGGSGKRIRKSIMLAERPKLMHRTGGDQAVVVDGAHVVGIFFWQDVRDHLAD